jgi:hypothetical protein
VPLIVCSSCLNAVAFIFIQKTGDDGTLLVEMVLPDGRNIGDTLCTTGLAVRARSDQPNVHGLSVSGGKLTSNGAQALPPCAVIPSSSSGLNNIPERVVCTLTLEMVTCI